jgi:YVTN family beta-propeller protein
VANSDSDNVSVIDTATNTVISTVPVGTFPVAIAITPDGTRAYVTNYLPNTVSVINTATNAVIATIPVGVGPELVAITPDGTRAYVPNIKSDTVSVINTTTNTVIATIPVGIFPFGAAITPDGTRAYVTNINPGTVSVIGTANNTVIANAPAGECPFGIAISPLAPIVVPVTIRGRVRSASGRGIFRAMLNLTDSEGNTQTVYTNSIGYYRFEGIAVGKTYNLTIKAKHYEFAPRVLTVNEEIKNLTFTAE